MCARFSTPVQTGHGALPASYTIGTGPFPYRTHVYMMAFSLLQFCDVSTAPPFTINNFSDAPFRRKQIRHTTVKSSFHIMNVDSWFIFFKGYILFPASFSFCSVHKRCSYLEMQEWVMIFEHIFNNGQYNEVGPLHYVNIRSALSGVGKYTVAKEAEVKERCSRLAMIPAFSVCLKRFSLVCVITLLTLQTLE